MQLKQLDSPHLWHGLDEGNEYVSLPPKSSLLICFTQIGASSIVPGNIFNIKYQIF